MNSFYTGSILIFVSVSTFSGLLFHVFFKRKILKKAKSLKSFTLVKTLDKKEKRLFFIILSFMSFILAFCLLTGTNILLGPGLFILSLFTPFIIISRRKKQIQKKFMKQFIPVLNQISNIVRAGCSLEEAFTIVASENPPPIGREFEILMAEYRISHDLKTSMENLHRRIPNRDLLMFVNSINISKRTGANIVEQLSNIRKTLTDRFYIEGKIKALTVQGRIQGIIASLLPVIIIFFIRLIDRHYFDPLLNYTLGHFIIGIAVCMNVLGVFLISRLSKIKF